MKLGHFNQVLKTLSQNFYEGHGFYFMTKITGNFYGIFSPYFSRFYKMITRPYITNLRQGSLD